MERLVVHLKHFYFRFFQREAHRIAQQVLRLAGRAHKAEPDSLEELLAHLKLDEWVELIDPTATTLQQAFEEGGHAALVELEINDKGALYDVISEAAIQYADERAAELVGKRILDDGRIVNNPNPAFAITETTRERLRAEITDAIAKALPEEELAANIQHSYAFSEARADLIVRTELGRAVVGGNVEAWRASGVVAGKRWILGSLHDVDDICDENADAEMVGRDEDFPSGDDAPPAHPNCYCDVVAVLEGDEED